MYMYRVHIYDSMLQVIVINIMIILSASQGTTA